MHRKTAPKVEHWHPILLTLLTLLVFFSMTYHKQNRGSLTLACSTFRLLRFCHFLVLSIVYTTLRPILNIGAVQPSMGLIPDHTQCPSAILTGSCIVSHWLPRELWQDYSHTSVLNTTSYNGPVQWPWLCSIIYNFIQGATYTHCVGGSLRLII